MDGKFGSDIIVRVRFDLESHLLKPERISGNIAGFIACEFHIEGQSFSSRLFHKGIEIVSEEPYELPIRFAVRDLVMPKIYIGARFALQRGGLDFARGEVLSIGPSENIGFSPH